MKTQPSNVRSATILLCIFVVLGFVQRGSSAESENLREILLSYEWSLNSPPEAWGYWTKGIFHPDGTATIVGYSAKKQTFREYTWAWKVTGNRTMLLGHLDKPNEHVWTFNQDLTTFTTPTWTGASGHRGTRLVATSGNVNLPTDPAIASKSRIDELIERKSDLMADIFGPLDRGVPSSIRDYVADLRENLLDEGARRPVATAGAYELAARFYNGLIVAYDERAKMSASLRNDAPSNAAGGPTTTKVHPNWIDYLRERDEAAAATQNNTLKTPFAKMLVLQWSQKALQMRQSLDALYAQFRDAARQPVVSSNPKE